MLSPTCTDAIPPQYLIASTVLMLSLAVLNSLHSADAIPPQYWCYPPHVLMLSPAVLQLSLHSTDTTPTCTAAIPPQCWCYSSTVLMLFPSSTELLPHSTEQLLQYWCCPPHVLMVSPTVLDSLRSTEPTLYGVIRWLWRAILWTIPAWVLLSLCSN